MAEETLSPYDAALKRLESLGGHYKSHAESIVSPVEPQIPEVADANLIPAGFGAALGLPQAISRTLRGTPAPTATVADLARAAAVAEGAPAGGMLPAGAPRATGKGAGVVNWANAVTPELTALEAKQAGDYKQAWQQNLRAQQLAEQTKGFKPGENLLLPREVIEEQAARQALMEKRAARPQVGQIFKEGFRQAGNVLNKGMPIVGGGAAGYELANAIDEYSQGDPVNAAISGLSGAGGLMMMSRNPMRIGAGALMTVPSLVRSGYRALTKPDQ